jgi:hypothetical protein
VTRRWAAGGAVLRPVLAAVGFLCVPAAAVRPMEAEHLYLLPVLTFGVVGWLLTQRRPENPEGWVFLYLWSVSGLFYAAGYLTDLAVRTHDLTAWWAWLGAWLVNWLWAPMFVLATAFPLLLFPGGYLSPRWGWVGRAAGLLAAWVALCGMVSPVLGFGGDGGPYVHNPLSPSFLAGAGVSDNWPLRNLGLLGIAVTAVLGAVSVFVRTRRATGVERVQLRWVAFAGVLMAVLVLSQSLPIGALANTTVAGTAVWAVLLSLLPAAMGVSILRYRLYDIDRLISRTTSYAVVTGLLVATYAAVVTLASRLLGLSSTLGVAAATLAAAGLARPLLRRVQNTVDRRFNRARYDAEHTVEVFGRLLRDQLRPEQVEQDLLTAVIASVQPASATVWLRS